MFLIKCPHCGEAREEDEFAPSGQAHIVRPLDPEALSDEQWGQYLYFRENPRGLHREMWVHAAGCRKFFYIARDTATYQIHATYRVGETYDQTTDTVVGRGES